MCGIAGIFSLKQERQRNLKEHLQVMNALQAHRGPDGDQTWTHPKGHIGFGHRRLSIIDLEKGQQPMTDRYGNTLTFNGEIYNYLELRKELSDYGFITDSDTEVLLAAYWKWGEECLEHLRGMFAFALWDDRQQKLFCARDRFGIKPLYFAEIDEIFYFASEAKALIPFLPEIQTDREALHDYLVFQFCLGTKTLFEGISQLPPAYSMSVKGGKRTLSKYWDVYYTLDFSRSASSFEEELKEKIEESVALHTRSDVPIGGYLSGGIDSGIISSVAAEGESFLAFHGRFEGESYDESHHARALAKHHGMGLREVTLTSQDFLNSIEKVIYHLDYPLAGPGSFPQYHVSELASKERKVVLGGQGGDELFGGYTRYLLAYFEQCIKAAINGTGDHGDFIVTYASIIPNLTALQKYQPMMQHFWKEGLFAEMDERYFRLIDRSEGLNNEVLWRELGSYSPKESYREIFCGNNVGKESYFDQMTHFDFKTLLPALLHVEDRMSMAHGIEARVPFLDHPLVELAATMPSNIKFKNGTLKRALVHAMRGVLPDQIIERKDKMGFPVPLNGWMKGELKEFFYETFNSCERPYFNKQEILKGLATEKPFGRKIWGLLSLELWHKQFHDRHAYFKKKVQQDAPILLTC